MTISENQFKLNQLESVHRNSVDRLVREFGSDKDSEINQLYNIHRDQLEIGAKLHDFIPVLAYRQARDYLHEKYL